MSCFQNVGKCPDVACCWVHWCMLSGTFFGCQLWFGIWWHQYGHSIASPCKVVPWGPWCQVGLSLQTSSNFIQFRWWFVIIMRLQVGLMLEVLLNFTFCRHPLMFVFGDMETCLPCNATARLFQDRRWHETLDHLDRNMQAFPNGRSGKKIINLSPCASCTTLCNMCSLQSCNVVHVQVDKTSSVNLWKSEAPAFQTRHLTSSLWSFATMGRPAPYVCIHSEFLALQGFGSLLGLAFGDVEVYGVNIGVEESTVDINLCNWLITFVHLCLVK